MKIKLLSLLLMSTLLFGACISPLNDVSQRSQAQVLSEKDLTTPSSESESEPEPEPESEPEPLSLESVEESSEEEPDPILPDDTNPLITPDQKPKATQTLSDVPAMTDEFIHSRLSRPLTELEGLDNTVITWGPGPTSGEARPSAPLELQAKYGDYGAWFIAPQENKVYLTFDEGYDAGYNGEILDALDEKNAKAIFFITLGFARSRPDLIRRMIDDGHMLGNHSWRHLSFPTMDMMDCAKDIMALHEFILDNFGYEMTVCRPPEGAFSIRSLALLDSLGYESMFWSFAYRDWILDEQPSTDNARDTIVNRSHPGAIYLLHAVSSTNAIILPDVIDQLREKGYEISPW